jgi:dipeptidyl aminopeptidase/acylaminoacyl peptidase
MVSRGPRLSSPPLLLALALVLVVAACGGGSKAPPATGSTSASLNVTTSPKERLYVLDGDGFSEVVGGKHNLILAPPPQSFIYDASISRDGQQLAVAIQLPPTQGETQSQYDFGVDLYVNAAGSTQLNLLVKHQRTGEIVSRPNWLPGGKQLIFADYGRLADGTADLHIETVDVTTGERKRLLDNAIEPALSPDAKSLAYVAIDPTNGAEELSLYDLATGASRLVVSGQNLVNVSSLAWSPDGKRLAFASADLVTAPVPAPPAPTVAAPPAASNLQSPALELMHPTLADAWVVNLDGTGLAKRSDLGDSSLSLAWSADDVSLYALGDTGFWRINADTAAIDHLGDGVLAGRVQTIIAN